VGSGGYGGEDCGRVEGLDGGFIFVGVEGAILKERGNCGKKFGLEGLLDCAVS